MMALMPPQASAKGNERLTNDGWSAFMFTRLLRTALIVYMNSVLVLSIL